MICKRDGCEEPVSALRHSRVCSKVCAYIENMQRRTLARLARAGQLGDQEMRREVLAKWDAGLDIVIAVDQYRELRRSHLINMPPATRTRYHSSSRSGTPLEPCCLS